MGPHFSHIGLHADKLQSFAFLSISTYLHNIQMMGDPAMEPLLHHIDMH